MTTHHHHTMQGQATKPSSTRILADNDEMGGASGDRPLRALLEVGQPAEWATLAITGAAGMKTAGARLADHGEAMVARLPIIRAPDTAERLADRLISSIFSLHADGWEISVCVSRNSPKGAGAHTLVPHIQML